MKKILIVVTVLLLFFGITQCINVFIINKSKENFTNIPKIEGHESIYETTFDDKKVVFYQRNNDIYYTVDDQAFTINNLNAEDGITRFWWANADEQYYMNDELMEPVEVFKVMDREIAIYYLDSTADVFVIYPDEQEKDYVSYILENTVSTEKYVDNEKIKSFVEQLDVISESDSVSYTFKPENPMAIAFRFPYHKVDFVNSMTTENTQTYTLSMSGEQKGILEYADRKDHFKNTYYQLTEEQMNEFGKYIQNRHIEVL